jgi:hypothetical protein
VKLGWAGGDVVVWLAWPLPFMPAFFALVGVGVWTGPDGPDGCRSAYATVKS